MSRSSNLNFIRFMIENNHKYQIDGIICTNNRFNSSFENIPFLDYKNSIINSVFKNQKIVLFNYGNDLNNELLKLKEKYSLSVPQNIYPFEFDVSNTIVNFSNLFSILSFSEIAKFFLLWRSKGKRLCIINGNCQTGYITSRLIENKSFNQRYIVVDIPRICNVTNAELNNINFLIMNADLIITQLDFP